jgi:hypothetical protein
MTARASAMGSKPRLDIASANTLSFKLFDGILGNLHQASGLGCFIVHVVPSVGASIPASATRSRVSTRPPEVARPQPAELVC